MDEKTHWINKLSFFVDENKSPIQYGLYSVAFISLGFVLTRGRPFKKFCSAKDISQNFIDSHLKLSGKVLSIEIGSPLLLYVDHKPILFARYRRISNPGIAAELASINISSNGISWLNTIIVGKDVDFTLFQRNKNYVTCIVHHNKKNVSENLVELGFASVDPINFELENDPMYQKYYKRLLELEKKADSKGEGMWNDGRRTYGTRIKETILNTIKKAFIKLRYG